MVLGEDQDDLCATFQTADAFEGDLVEIVAYSDDLTTTEQTQVNSYLAIKYGVTLDQSSGSGGTAYLDSAGSTIWATDTSDEFENDIAGIGQDDDADLDQINSQSQHTDGILRVADATSQDNLDFFTWSNNDGAATWTSAGAPNGFLILSRQWQAQDIGDTGTVELEFDVADSDFDVPALDAGTVYYFVYDADNDGDLSDETPIAMVDDGTGGDDNVTLAYDAQSANFTVGSTLTGGTSSATATIVSDSDAGSTGTLTLTSVSGTFQNDETITDAITGSATSNGVVAGDDKWTTQRDFVNTGDGKIDFSLAEEAPPAPGGVTSSLNLWVKADTGVFTDTDCSAAASNGNTIACWQDQSTGGFDMTRATNIPDLDSTGLAANFNHNSFLSFSSEKLANAGAVLASGDNATIFAVANNATLSGRQAVAAFDTGDPGVGTQGTDLEVVHGVTAHTGGFTLSAGTTYLMDWSWDQSANATTGLKLRLLVA